MKKLIALSVGLLYSASIFAHTTTSDVAPNFKFVLSKAKSEERPSEFLKVVPGKILGFTKVPKEKERLLKSFEVIEAVMNSKEFKNKVIGFQGTGPTGGFTLPKELTNEEVYAFLMQGRELIDGDTTLGEMNLDVSRYKPWYKSAVIGRTYPGKSKKIEVNGQHYSKLDVANMASNITHEWIHLNGFSHSSASDHDSVPYAVGYIVRDLAQKYLDQGYLD